jgi:hypothetical protein
VLLAAVSYAGLIELCVRHAGLKAADVVAAADMLPGICSTPADWLALLSTPAAAAAAATALASVVKRAAGFIKAAGAVADEPVLTADSLQLAACCFPAVAPAILTTLGNLAGMCCAALAWDMQQQQQQQQHVAAASGVEGGNSSSSSSRCSQSWASAVLLAVLLARSAVVLADAMDAAAAAAGITPAQLLARWATFVSYTATITRRLRGPGGVLGAAFVKADEQITAAVFRGCYIAPKSVQACYVCAHRPQHKCDLCPPSTKEAALLLMPCLLLLLVNLVFILHLTVKSTADAYWLTNGIVGAMFADVTMIRFE